MEKKLSILVLLPFVPFPPDDGGKIGSYTFIENLRGRYNFTVLMPAPNKDLLDRIEAQKAIWTNVTLIASTFDNEGFKNKIYALLRFVYSSLRRAITSESRIFDNHYLLYPFLSTDINYLNALNRLLKENHYDIIQAEYVHTLALVNIMPRDVKTVYIDHESRYSLLHDQSSLEPTERKDYSSYIVENVKTIESAFLARYDSIIALSTDDEKRLKNLLPGKKIYRSPVNLIKEPDVAVSLSSFSLDKLIFIGPEYHSPNKDAVRWFIEEIYPHLSKYNIKYYVIGKWSKRFKRKYRHNRNIVFTGFIDDINTFIPNSLHVIPVRLGGGGLRLKVLLSMSQGVPVVGTSKACYGFDLTHGKNVMIAETSSEFVEHISYLLDDPDNAQTLAQNAYLHYQENFSVKVTTEIRNSFYCKIMEPCDDAKLNH